jgi:4-amino-4-deoxy-L-arabinose transferase-like glycosyltransferase
LLLAGAFVASGLISHAPWTASEAQSLAAVESIVESGDYLLPRVDGEPALQSPPLYYMAGAGIAQAAAAYLPAEQAAQYLPAEQAARVATGVFLAIALVFTALFGRAAWRRGDDVPPVGVGAASVLVLIGTLGVIWFGHDMATDSALLAGMAVALYGMALLPRKILWGGFWLGTGAGIAFMAKGPFGPMVLGVAALLLPFLGFPRFGRYLRGIIVAVVFALPWLLIWPLLLQQRDPALYEAWLSANSLDTFLAGIDIKDTASQLEWLRLFLTMAFPAWLLAVLTLVLRPVALFGFAGVRAALVVTLVGWAALVLSDALTPVYGFALLVPLAVIGAGGVLRLPRWFVWPAHWLSALLFGAIAAALWGAWIWLMHQGEPPPVEALGQYLPMDYGFQWQPAVYVTAAVLTLIWLWAVMRFRPSRPAALLAWPAGVVMVWSLVALHQPWIDAAIAEGTLAKAIPAELAPQPGLQAEPAAPAPAADTGVEAAAAPAATM